MRIARRTFGNTDLDVSALGLGTAEVGFSETGDDAFDLMLGVASDAGINVLDSAAMYGDAEASLGRLLGWRMTRQHKPGLRRQAHMSGETAVASSVIQRRREPLSRHPARYLWGRR